MDDALFWHRLQFAFTITYHYLFPQLTMGLAWILVYWKWRHLRTGDDRYANALRFWARIFGITFTVGVVTGIPWNSSLAPTGRISPGTPATSSAKRSPWKGCSPSSSRARWSAPWSGVRNDWARATISSPPSAWPSAVGFPGTSSS